jgi:tripartite-type tricarboxylate transporter receptor subunit TctC
MEGPFCATGVSRCGLSSVDSTISMSGSDLRQGQATATVGLMYSTSFSRTFRLTLVCVFNLRGPVMRMAVLALLSFLIGPAIASDIYPSRRVEIIVPYGPGGTGDVIARQLAKKFGDQLGEPFVVLNKPGAAGTLGATYVARAQPDGYTLLLGYTSEIAIEPFLKSIGYDSTNFEPIAIAGETPLLLIGRKTLPADNMQELLSIIRTKPDAFTYASAGYGSPAHIASELLNRDAKITVRHIPFKGGAEAVAAVLGAQVDVYFTGMPPAVPLVQNGNIKAFALTGERRSKALPDVPTMAESGFSNFELSGWFSLFAPKRTPPDILVRLRTAAADALADISVQQALNKNGVEIDPEPTKGVDRFIAAESRKYRKLIDELGIKESVR